MSLQKTKPSRRDSPTGRQWLALALIAVPVMALIGYGVFLDLDAGKIDTGEPFVIPRSETSTPETTPSDGATAEPNETRGFKPDLSDDGRGTAARQNQPLRVNTNHIDPKINVLFSWDRFPKTLVNPNLEFEEKHQNITRADYAGPQSCRECHKENHNDWQTHAHRSMNALANDETVKADFSGSLKMNYLGGEALFHRDGTERRMTLSRDGTNRTYSVTRTLGSRFFQYYIGYLKEGPEPENHLSRAKEQLLPVGYWIDKRMITPMVHIQKELPDGERYDPFSGPTGMNYDHECAMCHTTVPAGDWMLLYAGSARLQDFTPRSLLFFATEYLTKAHPALFTPENGDFFPTGNEIKDFVVNDFLDEIKPDKAVTLGISCEACHMGCLEHTKNEEQKPRFFLSSPLIHIPKDARNAAFERTDANRNWICSRCHSGTRPKYAGGMDTWNSTEYSDAIKGFCYDAKTASAHNMRQLTCVHCHDPHKGIGKKWPLTPQQDDAKCVDCHGKFKDPANLISHTHHPSDSAGSRCMNCHMPKINEGLQDMVRTHVIFNPTNREMIEGNQPNACNLCHVDKPIDWTIGRLREWYGERHEYSDAVINRNYPDRGGPAGAGYLKSPVEAVRLAASEAMFKQQARWAMPDLIDMLNDPFLINRQFTQKNFEQEFGLDPRRFGYQFTLTPEERQAPIQRMRDALIPPRKVQ